jgi:hypothetical protein
VQLRLGHSFTNSGTVISNLTALVLVNLETLAVLGAWAALGLPAAPAILRRLARRESGSAVATGREQVAQRPF